MRKHQRTVHSADDTLRKLLLLLITNRCKLIQNVCFLKLLYKITFVVSNDCLPNGCFFLNCYIKLHMLLNKHLLTYGGLFFYIVIEISNVVSYEC